VHPSVSRKAAASSGDPVPAGASDDHAKLLNPCHFQQCGVVYASDPWLAGGLLHAETPHRRSMELPSRHSKRGLLQRAHAPQKSAHRVQSSNHHLPVSSSSSWYSRLSAPLSAGYASTTRSSHENTLRLLLRIRATARTEPSSHTQSRKKNSCRGEEQSEQASKQAPVVRKGSKEALWS
jgi:hypothetical protein